MVDTTLDNVFNGLTIRNHGYFYACKGFEMMQGFEKDWFYVVSCHHVPGIYMHW
jgi:hypothetical protein